MRIMLFLQHFMGLTLTAGFFAHDIYFTDNFIGINTPSVVFLLSLFWFHLLVYLREAGLVHLRDEKHQRLITRLKIFVGCFISIAIIFADIHSKNNGSWYIFEILFLNVIHLFILIFPEYIFRLVFVFDFKRNKSENID